MITRIYAHGFKGLDFDQHLGRRTLVMGRVGSGKSSRSLALALLVTGSLPGTGISRTNAEILKSVGSGDVMTVGIELDGETTLERAYKRKKDGSVSCDCRVHGERTAKNLFDMEIDRLGISIADVPAFLALSDAKKIDELFRLFPPAGDVRGLNTSIARSKESISKTEGDIKGKEQSCRSLSDSMADLALPAGSLPEVQAEIAKVEREYLSARDALSQERARLELEAKNAQREQQKAQARQPSVPATQPRLPLNETAHPETPAPAARQASGSASLALGRVLAALERAGCDGCAARMVLKREIRLLRAM